MDRVLETLKPACDGIRQSAGRLDRRYWIGAGLLLLLPVAVCFSTGDAAEAAKRKALDYELSETAARVATLLDREAYAAARGILNAKLPQHPDDAGLHVQYARYILLTRSVADPGAFRTPLFPDEKEYYAQWVVREAASRAMQLDDKAGPYAAVVLMTTLRDRIEQELKANNGVIGGKWEGGKESTVGPVAMELPYVGEPAYGFNQSTINVAWAALEADPATAAAFRDDFRKLTEKAVETGKVSSAVMLGNLVGDLESEGKDNTRDFELACDAFERALPNYPGGVRVSFVFWFYEVDWAKDSISFFRRIYTAELEAARKGDAPESFERLQKALAERGLSLFEEPKRNTNMPIPIGQ